MKETAKKIRSISQNVEDHAKFLSETKIDAGSLKKPLQDTIKSRAPGDRLLKAGFALTVFSPDPFTDVIGIPMMATGYALKKTRSCIGIKDITVELNENLKTLKDLKLDL
ncbi:MAG: hypothetical protein M1503_05775 [Thaumarchaeota archaeon]|nr:hypothetical protein [Nitrososphaerota archaeon]MCL5317755.1 hypothetical protein [Nitrososphaerota archaeon]